MEERPHKPHVLIVPYPAQGHINPMLQFAKRLLPKGIKATLATTVSTFKSMHINPTTSVAIETISDGFDEGGYSESKSAEVYVESLKRVGSETLSKLIKKLGENGQPVTAVVYDGFMPWALDVAKEFGLLGMVFFTQSCAVNNIYYHVYKGLLPLPLSETTVSIPGLPVLQASETPSFIHDFGSYPGFYHMVVNQFSNIDQADWVLFNTFYKLEETCPKICLKCVQTYLKGGGLANQWKLGTIGPTLPSFYLDKGLEDDKDYEITLFKPKTEACMSWLNDKPKNSVVYVSFGSMAEAQEEQVEELAWGLKSSNCFFLWVVRETEETKLPKDFKEEASENGLVVSWCPQLEVLTHESIGCFVTHCGLNSVLEALSLGIPMVAMPQWSDQTTNAKFVTDVWKTGIRAWSDEKGIVRREVVEMCVKEVIEGEKGKEIKENAKIWEGLAREAVGEGGSSDKAIDEFVINVLLR